MVAHRDDLLTIIREAKQRKKTVVAGGPYPTSLPEEVMDAGCDFLVRGEAEDTIASLVSALTEGKSSGVFENRIKPNVTESPIPRFDLLRLPDYSAIGIQTSRGCPFDCEFCDIVNLYGRQPRYKNPDQVVAELETLYGLGWRGVVFVSDDNFIGNKAHARAILEKLIPWMKSHNEPFQFWTQASVNLGQDLEMIDLMTDANFSDVFIGIESPDEDVLRFNRKFQNIRNPLVESMDNINRNGLTIMGSFIVGFDNEEKGAGERICAFVEETSIPIVMINTLQAAPNTRLWERLKKEGRLIEERTSGDTLGGGLNFRPTRPESEIMAESAEAWAYLYETSRYLARIYRYFLNMRPTRSAVALERGESLPERNGDGKKFLSTLWISIFGFLYLMRKLGLRASSTRQFWKQLVLIRMRNPSRVVQYLNLCFFGCMMSNVKSEVSKRSLLS
jgi:radical SAM superfamily enzyme YgiQ (UPF0313 family)